MAQQTINIGASPNNGLGDPLRTAGSKINSNFTELYSVTNGLGTASTKASDTDGTLAANSDSRVPTQKAVKTYVDTKTAAYGTAATLAFDTDSTLAANSDSRVPTQKAVKSYMDAGLAGKASTSYVDGKLAGLSWKQAVRVATTTDGTLASAFANGSTVDGVTLATGDRILIKDQSTASQNGIYTVNASGAPTRATDADSGAELVNATCYVSEGSTNADTQWTCSTNATITVGTTSLTFALVSSGLTYSADGSTLALSGSTFSIANGGVGTNQLASGAVTLGKIANAAASSKLLGSGSSGSGVSYSELTLGSGLTITGTTISVTGMLVATNNLSDVGSASTARSNLGAAGSGAITASGLTQATNRLLGRTTASTGAVEEISVGTGLSFSGGVLATNGVLLATNNLSDLGNAATARGNLGATTVGSNVFTATNPSAITFLRVNADNTVSFLSASAFRTAIGAGAGGGDLVSTNNLSDVASVSTARSNLGAAASGAITSSGLTQATDRLLGRTTASTGAVEEISIGTGLTFASGSLSLTITGDTDGTLAANSDTKFATQKAVKTYIDGGLSAKANISYVDNLIAGLSWKQTVRAATTTAGTLATAFENGDSIDGVTLATGDRILIKNQSTASENGIYVVNASGAPTRATDADSGAELVNASCYVSEGTANADTQWTCSTNGPITVGSTSITFTQFASGGVPAGAITTSGLTQATNRLLGRTTASTGAIEELTVGAGLSLSAGSLSTSGAYTAAGFTMSTSRLLGRTTASTGAAEEISVGTGLTFSGGSLSVNQAAIKPTESIIIAASDEATALTTGTAKVTFRMPYAMTLTDVRASLATAQASGSIFTVDINEGGTSILSTKLTIDNTEKTSTTAATAAVISDSSLADDAEITIDIDQIGTSGAKGLKVVLIGNRT